MEVCFSGRILVLEVVSVWEVRERHVKNDFEIFGLRNWELGWECHSQKKMKSNVNQVWEEMVHSILDRCNYRRGWVAS